MKLFAKLMLATLVIALLLPFTILKNEQGKTLMSFSDFSLPDFSLPGLSSAKKLVPSNPVTGGKDKFYKWYDSKGDLQFTTEPPPDGIEYTVKEFDPNANVIQAVEIPVVQPEDLAATSDSGAGKNKSSDANANPYSKESVEKLFEDTKNIEKLLNQRMQNQNAAIN